MSNLSVFSITMYKKIRNITEKRVGGRVAVGEQNGCNRCSTLFGILVGKRFTTSKNRISTFIIFTKFHLRIFQGIIVTFPVVPIHPLGWIASVAATYVDAV